MTDAESFTMLCMDDDFDKCAAEIDNYYRGKWNNIKGFKIINLNSMFTVLFLALESDQIPELNWKCPGRRPPHQQEEAPKIEATVKEQQ